MIGSLSQGGYDPFVRDPAEASALTATLWELSLLQNHYHPHIALSAAVVAGIPPEGGAGKTGGPITGAQGPIDLVHIYAAELGAFSRRCSR